LLPKMATKLYCPHWQQYVAEIGNKLLPISATICFRNRQQIVAENLLPISATICCRNGQQIVASGQCGQA